MANKEVWKIFFRNKAFETLNAIGVILGCILVVIIGMSVLYCVGRVGLYLQYHVEWFPDVANSVSIDSENVFQASIVITTISLLSILVVLTPIQFVMWIRDNWIKAKNEYSMFENSEKYLKNKLELKR